ncbi:hypothetical protein CDCA_CDCA15G3946 [Cyanidium caldarium]|uniref:Uncharacterized protein n=1 Tax=Cyanidium caldarium TaxID=2771 RepID=A0AAV9J0K9_CYACA|nr:hypothetical protein CDCA_CDCA15G3946 [Cyanidium caldarium]
MSGVSETGVLVWLKRLSDSTLSVDVPRLRLFLEQCTEEWERLHAHEDWAARLRQQCPSLPQLIARVAHNPALLIDASIAANITRCVVTAYAAHTDDDAAGRRSRAWALQLFTASLPSTAPTPPPLMDVAELVTDIFQALAVSPTDVGVLERLFGTLTPLCSHPAAADAVRAVYAALTDAPDASWTDTTAFRRFELSLIDTDTTTGYCAFRDALRPADRRYAWARHAALLRRCLQTHWSTADAEVRAARAAFPHVDLWCAVRELGVASHHDAYQQPDRRGLTVPYARALSTVAATLDCP